MDIAATSYTRIIYSSADPFNTYTMYNPADVRWDVLNDIMSLYNLHIYRILGLNGVDHLSTATCVQKFLNLQMMTTFLFLS